MPRTRRTIACGRQRTINRLAVIAAMGVLALGHGGCASPESSGRPARPVVRPGEFGEAACFFARQAQDFQALDDRNLIVFAPSQSQAYHLQISPPASDLRFANGLAFVSRHTQVCGYPGDDVVVAEGPAPRRHSITGVWRLDDAALQALRLRFGHGEAPRPVAPAAPEGATIEPELDAAADKR